jgi:hypothetical protein
LQAKDGGKVQINVAKFIMKKLTVSRIAELEKSGSRAKDGTKLTEEFYECKLFASTGNRTHGQFVKVGANTGNLMKHCDRFHEEMIAGIERLVAETPAEEAAEAITRWVSNVAPPAAPLDRFLARRPEAMLSAEVSGLIWFWMLKSHSINSIILCFVILLIGWESLVLQMRLSSHWFQWCIDL